MINIPIHIIISLHTHHRTPFVIQSLFIWFYSTSFTHNDLSMIFTFIVKYTIIVSIETRPVNLNQCSNRLGDFFYFVDCCLCFNMYKKQVLKENLFFLRKISSNNFHLHFRKNSIYLRNHFALPFSLLLIFQRALSCFIIWIIIWRCVPARWKRNFTAQCLFQLLGEK